VPAGWSEVKVPKLPYQCSRQQVKFLDAILRDAVIRLEEGQHPMRVRNAILRDHAKALGRPSPGRRVGKKPRKEST
jgi:hypothetical protein